METTENVHCSLENYRLIRETKEYRHTPFSFREYLCKDKRLTQTSKIAWMVLSDYSVFSSEFKIHMSLRTLGDKIGKDKRTAKRALEELEKYGYIKTNLRNGEKGNDRTIIWVRFPQDAVLQILQKPNRKVSLEAAKLKVIYPSTMEAALKNTNDAVVENSGVLAKPEAFLLESGAIALPINTKNITNLTITKGTNNNVSYNQASGNIPRVLNRLRDVECLFLKFVERTNVLKKQELSKIEFENNLWEPYNDWEKQVIERFNAIRYEPPMQDIENISAAIPVKLKYDQEFAKAKSLGVSALQASRIAQGAMTREEVNLYHAITWVISRLQDILEPSSNKMITQKEENQHQPKNSIIINLNPPSEPVLITQTQADKIVVKLKKAVKNGEISGEASRTDLKTLSEQLIFHVEHWSPRLIYYKSSEERTKIATNVALKRMKEGTWSAPYGWIKQRILQREKEVQQSKQLEVSTLKGRTA